MKTLLVITSSIDVTVDYMMKKFNNQAIFYRINVDELMDYKIRVGGNDSWSICAAQWNISKNDISSIYYRKPMLPDLSEYQKCYQGMIAKDIIALINGMVDDFDGKVLTKPSILRKTENKTFQLLYAIKNHIPIPKSFIGTDEEIASMLIKEKAIVKPLTTGKIINKKGVEIFQTSYIKNLDENVRLTPIYTQTYEEKAYEVRLTCIGSKKFAVRIDARDKLDWRKDYASLSYSLIECPDNISTMCDKLMKDFGLEFGAFDFIVNHQGEWIFLEVNPNGQWLWLERELNISISNSIFENLAI